MILGVWCPWRDHRKPAAPVRFQAGEPGATNAHLPGTLRLHQADRQQPAPAEKVLLLHLHASGLHAPLGGGVGTGQPQLLSLRIFPATGRDCPEVSSPTFKASRLKKISYFEAVLGIRVRIPSKSNKQKFLVGVLKV
jgi:hypothetical protein